VTILSKELPEGMYTQQWDATELAAGMYFCRFQAGSFSKIGKIILLR
jgi:hypothetical protein